jgi:UDP-3-O-[3-hydroxymyristoyl] glucosamine N-acyltransferase
MQLRKMVIQWLDNNQLLSPAYVHSNVMLDHRATIHPGTVAYGTAYLQNAVIGKHCFFSAFTLVSHEAVLGNNVVLYPYSTCLGSCIVGDNTLLQTRSTVSNKIVISCNDVNLLPMTFVNKDITVSGTYGGTSAKLINKNAY